MPVTLAPVVGAVRATVGGVVSFRVAVSVAAAVLPAASRAVTVTTLAPGCRAIPLAVQLVVPTAVPLPPRSFVHVTWVTPTLSDAVPPSAIGELVAVYVAVEVGVAMVTAGRVESTEPRPVTTRVTLVLFAVKIRFTLAVATTVGVKRTVTACVVPVPTALNEPPDTMLKGAETDAVPETVPPLIFCTVKVWSAKLPMVTVPKSTVAAGLTPKSTRATALVEIGHVLSLPLVFTAVTAT